MEDGEWTFGPGEVALVVLALELHCPHLHGQRYMCPCIMAEIHVLVSAIRAEATASHFFLPPLLESFLCRGLLKISKWPWAVWLGWTSSHALRGC